jgi:hypothetical protein
MTDQLTQQDVNNTAWAACDTFRGVSIRRSTRTTSW